MTKLQLLAALSTSLIACGRPQVIALQPAPEVERPGQMTVTGQATLEVSPDCADLTMTLSADGAKPALATSAVDQKEHALVDALHHLGVENGDLKLSLVSLDPIYEPNPDGWAQIKVHTYRAQITVTATTHDFGKIAALMDAGADAGATQMSSQFRNSDLPALKKKVRDMALAAAKDKAKQMADGVGIKLGRVISIGESNNGVMWNQTYFPQATANFEARSNSGITLGGTLQPLTLDVTIGYELAKEA